MRSCGCGRGICIYLHGVLSLRVRDLLGCGCITVGEQLRARFLRQNRQVERNYVVHLIELGALDGRFIMMSSIMSTAVRELVVLQVKVLAADQ